MTVRTLFDANVPLPTETETLVALLRSLRRTAPLVTSREFPALPDPTLIPPALSSLPAPETVTVLLGVLVTLPMTRLLVTVRTAPLSTLRVPVSEPRAFDDPMNPLLKDCEVLMVEVLVT